MRLKMLGGVLIGVLLAVTVITLLSVRRQTPAPVAESQPAEPPAVAAPAVSPTPAESRSRGQSDWAFFFRPGDTLSRMGDGGPLGVVVRLERQHRFADGSTGPAYVVRSPDKAESVFDADELERRARIEAIQDLRVPPARRPDSAPGR